MIQIRVPVHFQKLFCLLFQYLFNTTLKKFNTMPYLQFVKFLIMELNFTPLHNTAQILNCFAFSKTVITCKEQDLKNQWLKTYCTNLNKPNAVKLVCFVYTPKRGTKKLEWNSAQRQENTVANYIYTRGHKHMAHEHFVQLVLLFGSFWIINTPII